MLERVEKVVSKFTVPAFSIFGSRSGRNRSQLLVPSILKQNLGYSSKVSRGYLRFQILTELPQTIRHDDKIRDERSFKK